MKVEIMSHVQDAHKAPEDIIISVRETPRIPLEFEVIDGQYLVKLTEKQIVEVKSALELQARQRDAARLASTKKRATSSGTSKTTKSTKPHYIIDGLPSHVKVNSTRKRTPSPPKV